MFVDLTAGPFLDLSSAPLTAAVSHPYMRHHRRFSCAAARQLHLLGPSLSASATSHILSKSRSCQRANASQSGIALCQPGIDILASRARVPDPRRAGVPGESLGLAIVVVVVVVPWCGVVLCGPARY